MNLSFVKTHGGKGSKRLLKWIISQFPIDYPKLLYLEPFVGGGSVILNKEKSVYEAVNDLDKDTFYLYECAGNQSLLRVQNLPYSKNIFDFYLKYQPKYQAGFAEKEYVLRNMSRGGMKKAFAWSERKRGGLPGDENAWKNKLKRLPEICKRLRYVEKHNLDCIDFLKKFNKPNSFAYLDPPYLQETRTAKKVYNHEMSKQDHIDLLYYIRDEWKGKFLISGYESDLYKFMLKNYCNFDCLRVANNSGQNKVKNGRIECVWRNY